VQARSRPSSPMSTISTSSFGGRRRQPQIARVVALALAVARFDVRGRDALDGEVAIFAWYFVIDRMPRPTHPSWNKPPEPTSLPK
jgi:hypothetical protein